MSRSLLLFVVSVVAGCTGTPVGDAGPRADGDTGPIAPYCSPIPFVTACNGVARAVMDREFCVHVPVGYVEGDPTPVVMMLHGYSADGPGEAAYLGLNALADARTFILVLPNGANDDVGLHYWNASAACCAQLATSPPDDVAFLMAVLDDLESAYSVDTHREYVMGHSSGAFMAHRLACEHGARFAAAASFAGAANPDCHPEVPISFLEIHGTTDPTIGYDGGTALGGQTPYPSVEETLAYWTDANRCHGTREDVGDRELVCDDHELETHVERWDRCADDTVVELWRMNEQGHLPTFRLPTFGTDVLDFLFAHRR